MSCECNKKLGDINDSSYLQAEQFNLNFGVMSKAVSAYMIDEFNSGRLKDTNYANVQAQAIQVLVQQCVFVTMNTDSQQAQAALTSQQVETEKQKTELTKQQVLTATMETAKATVEVNQLLPEQVNQMVQQTELVKINRNKAEYELGNILPGQASLLTEQVAMVRLQEETEKNKTRTELAQGNLLASQKLMVEAQTGEVSPNALKQREVQSAQIEQVREEVKYTEAKTKVMRSARVDNLLIEAVKAQMQQLATVGAGGLVPSTNDFDAGNKSRQSVYNRAKQAAAEIGEDLPDITFAPGSDYRKAT